VARSLIADPCNVTMDIELLRADLTSIKVDAIVNPSSSFLQNGLAPGNAIVGGGNLLCRFVIHAVIPRMGEGDEDRKLRDATRAALHRAEELAVGSVAIPAMGTGVFGFPVERSARIMLGVAIDFRAQTRSLRRVVFCLFGAAPYEEFSRILQELGG
jgi:O-acetyl-ADP-ribose deacetylase (regulator of RNase III)